MGHGGSGVVHSSRRPAAEAARVKLEAGHYRCTAPSPVDLMANQIAFQFEPIATALPLVNDGRLKALAVTSLERAPSLPNVPTVVEIGRASCRERVSCCV